jgi:hypothetical protein
MKITIPVSVGELLDKISILEIKSLFTNNKYIKKELEELNRIKRTLSQYTLEYETQLKSVNQILWEIEDRIREKEKLQEFDDEFIELARGVYKNNDERARIKSHINELYKSTYREIKVY